MALNKDLHRINFITILRAIYSDPELRTVLGFKGGTAALLFYDLPRFSVDLDFDLLEPKKKEIVFEKVKAILEKNGVLSEATEKQYTLFYLLHYQKGERTIKVEISKRSIRSYFEIKNYLGISMLAMKKEDMSANKLVALLTRKEFASRDMFDLWFFLKNNWPISEEIVRKRTNLSLEEALKEAIGTIVGVNKNQLLRGIGEFLDNKQKAFVKEKGYTETLFGRRRYLPDINSFTPQIRAAAERAAVNFPIQGSAADIMKMAMTRAYQECESGKCRMLLQIHDELLFEVADDIVVESAQRILKIMEAAAHLSVSLAVQVKAGPAWGEMKKI